MVIPTLDRPVRLDSLGRGVLGVLFPHKEHSFQLLDVVASASGYRALWSIQDFPNIATLFATTPFSKAEKDGLFAMLVARYGSFKPTDPVDLLLFFPCLEPFSQKDLETPSLRLRKVTKDDGHDIFTNYAHDPEVTKYLTWDAYEKEEYLEGWLQQIVGRYELPLTFRWAIERKDVSGVIGMIDIVDFVTPLGPEFGYCLSRQQWNKGYMTEALGAVIAFLFSVGATEIYGSHVKENIGSKRVMEHCGLVYFDEHVEAKGKQEGLTIERRRLLRP